MTGQFTLHVCFKFKCTGIMRKPLHDITMLFHVDILQKALFSFISHLQEDQSCVGIIVSEQFIYITLKCF